MSRYHLTTLRNGTHFRTNQALQGDRQALANDGGISELAHSITTHLSLAVLGL